jgi:hypothetical protein
MFDPAILWICLFFLVGSVAGLVILEQFDGFRDLRERGAFFVVENMLIVASAVWIGYGVYYQGYKEGLRHGEATGNKT